MSEVLSRLPALTPAGRAHLRRLTGAWGILADLSFADLLLFGERSDGEFVVAGQARPATAQTLYQEDQVGRNHSHDDRPLVAKAFAGGQLVTASLELDVDVDRVRVTAIPVRCEGRIVAVMTAETARLVERREGTLERSYLDVFNRFVEMVAAGSFPFPSEDSGSEDAPRVGDGALVVNRRWKVTFSSPNAVSALHRVGFHAGLVGRRLDDMGFDSDLALTAERLKVPVSAEMERGARVMTYRIMPLLRDNHFDGALVLVRDVSDLRRRDRMLTSMDATIREIHHRVKNNLQTVSSLLRLQGRRVVNPEVRAELDEAARRIRSIALVHEILAHRGGDEVDFVDVVRPLVAMVSEGLVPLGQDIDFRLVGDAPTIPAATASSLAVVTAELLQNAVEHGYPAGVRDEGRVIIEMVSHGPSFTVAVRDDGIGLAPDFTLESSAGLGLTIAGTLASTELGGTLTLRPSGAADGGTVAELTVDLRAEGPDASR